LSAPAVAESRFRFGPVLGATITTVLLIWLFYSVAEVLLLLFIAVLVLKPSGLFGIKGEEEVERIEAIG